MFTICQIQIHVFHSCPLNAWTGLSDLLGVRDVNGVRDFESSRVSV